MNAVIEFTDRYVYLTSELFALLLLAAVLAGLPSGWRRTTVACALLSTPFALLGVVLVPEYWRPRGILQLPVLAEDVLFMFIAGAVAWLSGSWAYGERLTLGNPWHRGTLLRVVALLGTLMAAGACLKFCGVKVGVSMPVVWAVCAVMLFRLRPDLCRMMFVAATTFGATYFLMTACVFAAAPDFVSAWNHANLLGGKLLGVPVDEIVWATGFGAVWPGYLVYATGGRILERGNDVPGGGREAST